MQLHQRTGNIFEYSFEFTLIQFPLLQYTFQCEWEVLKHEVPFAVFDEIIEVVDDVFVLYFLVELVLSLLLLVVLTHLNRHEFLREYVSSFEYLSRQTFADFLYYCVSLF